MQRVPELDGVRAVAIIGVMGFHFATPFASGGSFGVDVFFVLSGYLITSILTEEADTSGRLDYGAFLTRRARRLVPALAVMLAAYAVVCPFVRPRIADQRWGDIATAALYLTNLRQTFAPADTPLTHTWSLAVEEQFYVLWPFVVLALRRVTKARAALILIRVWAVLTLARGAWFFAFPGSSAPYYFTLFRATGLVLGAALALRPVTVRSGAVPLAVIVALMIAGNAQRTEIFTRPILELMTALVIASPPAILAAPAAQFLGRISYGVYLWHFPILWALIPWVGANVASAPVYAVLSILVGAASYFGVEQWFLAPRRAAPSLPIATPVSA